MRIPGPGLRWKGSYNITLDMLKRRITWLMAHRDTQSGAIYGLPAEGYAEQPITLERPIWRVAADGVVCEIECTETELYPILRELRPVDYIKMPEGKTWLFIFYADPHKAEAYARLFGVREEIEDQPVKNKKYRSIDDSDERSGK